MIPILFEYNETDFTTHGIGDLIDCIECRVSQNEDGEFELGFVYPVAGELMSELTIGRLVYAKANPWQNPQIFRIYGYEKEIAGKITVNCQHISYDLGNIPVKVFKSAANASCNTVLQNVKTNAVSITGLNVSSFTFSSDVTGTAQTQKGYFEIESPTTVRAAILDGDESVKGCFGGDLVFDNYTVSLQATGGSDRGVMVEYGIDLMDLQQEENISEMYTGVLPYFTYTQDNDDNTPMVAYGTVQYASGTFRTHRIEPLDLTSYFPNQAEHTAPSQAQLNSKAREWMAKENGFGEPEINLTLSYATLGQDVRLYDAVTVRFVKMGIDVKSKVCSYTYDVLNERITEVEVGKTKPTVIFSLEDASRLRKGLLPPERVKDNSITNQKLGNGSVGGSKISGGGVSSYHLKNGAATKEKIADDAIDENKIEDGAVTEPKVKPLAITVSRIANGAVQTVKIADNAVITDKILAKAVTYAKSAYQGTLDQVGINQADIAAINALFVNSLSANIIQCAGWLRATDVFMTSPSNQFNSAASAGWVNNNFAWKDHTHSGYATSQDVVNARSYAANCVSYHQSRCGNWTG